MCAFIYTWSLLVMVRSVGACDRRMSEEYWQLRWAGSEEYWESREWKLGRGTWRSGKLGLKETVIGRVSKRRLTWFGRVMRMDGNRLPLKALHCYIRGNRSRGRQRKKWIDNVREDLELCNEDLTTATVLARDRSRWRRLQVKTSSSV